MLKHWLSLTILYVATLMVVAFARAGWPQLSAFLLIPPMVWLSVTDIGERIIPDTSILAIGGIGITFLYLANRDQLIILLPLAIGVLMLAWMAGEFFYRRTGRDGLGFGDAKLMAAGTLCVEPLSLWKAIFLASVGGIIAVAVGRRNTPAWRSQSVPFGPFLAYGFYLVHVTSSLP